MVNQESEPIKRLLKVDMGTLEIAFNDATNGISYYLDIETGEIIMVTPDSQFQLDDLRDEWESSGQSIGFADFLRQSDTPDWLLEMTCDALRVEEDIDSRYWEVPHADSSEGYHDMQDFAITVEDELLQRRLRQALDGNKPFRQFKDVLLNFPGDRERWFKFQNDRITQRILDWLDSRRITPILDDEEH